jgi:DNA-binding NarL/FixJ family response regulator
MLSVLIADDHPLLSLGTKTFLEQKGYIVVGVFENGVEAFNQIQIKKPTVALLDINMPGMSGMDILEKLHGNKLDTSIVILTMHNETSIFNRAKELGAKGFLLKEFAMDEMEKCLFEVERGRSYFSQHLPSKLTMNESEKNEGLDLLTFAEKKILQLIAQQKSSKEIASQLFISEKTVETHRSHIIKKLHLPPNKNALLKWALTNTTT